MAWLGAFVAANGKLYTLSGLSGNISMTAPTDAVDEYDPTTQTWTHRGRLDIMRQNAAAVAVAGHVYLMGGTLPSGFPSAVVVT